MIVSHFESLTPDLARIFIAPEAMENKMHYEAGQYLEILYPDGRFQPFSIANAETSSGIIELHIRHLPADLATKSLLQEIQQNKKIIIRGPLGKAIYRSSENPTILLAGGTGIAYIKAIVEECLKKNDQGFKHLFWSVKNQNDLYLSAEILKWQQNFRQFKYTPVISQLNQVYAHELIIQEYKNLQEFQVYAGGPAAMIFSALDLFTQNGLPRHQFISDVI